MEMKKRLVIRVGEEMHQLVHDAARKMNMNFTEWALNHLANAIDKEEDERIHAKSE